MWELIVVAAVVLGGVGLYNSLVKLREQAAAAWADIDVQLKRRYDLIPNVVETVKGYAAHEQKTLEAVVQARSSAMSAQGPAQKGQAEGMLAGALKSLFALAEAYPDLKAAGGFQDSGYPGRPRGLPSERPSLLQCRGPGLQHQDPLGAVETWSPKASTSRSGSSSRSRKPRRPCLRWSSPTTTTSDTPGPDHDANPRGAPRSHPGGGGRAGGGRRPTVRSIEAARDRALRRRDHRGGERTGPRFRSDPIPIHGLVERGVPGYPRGLQDPQRLQPPTPAGTYAPSPPRTERPSDTRRAGNATTRGSRSGCPAPTTPSGRSPSSTPRRTRSASSTPTRASSRPATTSSTGT